VISLGTLELRLEEASSCPLAKRIAIEITDPWLCGTQGL